jgi:hypothetical protein
MDKAIPLPQIIGRMILERVVGQDEYSEEIKNAARTALSILGDWDNWGNPGRLWHIDSESWKAFKEALEKENIDLSTILEDTK